ncbi:MAG: hypothetical protein ACK4GK_14995 [Ferrovibrio sp.]
MRKQVFFFIFGLVISSIIALFSADQSVWPFYVFFLCCFIVGFLFGLSFRPLALKKDNLFNAIKQFFTLRFWLHTKQVRDGGVIGLGATVPLVIAWMPMFPNADPLNILWFAIRLSGLAIAGYSGGFLAAMFYLAIKEGLRPPSPGKWK